MSVQRWPELGPGQECLNRLIGPYPVEEVALERQDQEIRMAVQQGSEKAGTGAGVPDDEDRAGGAHADHRSLYMRMSTVVFRRSGSAPPRLWRPRRLALKTL